MYSINLYRIHRGSDSFYDTYGMKNTHNIENRAVLIGEKFWALTGFEVVGEKNHLLCFHREESGIYTPEHKQFGSFMYDRPISEPLLEIDADLGQKLHAIINSNSRLEEKQDLVVKRVREAYTQLKSV